MGHNRWEGIGNLGADPELSYLASGTAVVNISLACNEKYKDKSGELKESTEWIRCVLFDKRAETLAKYCHKGSKLFVEGKLRTRKWQDKEGNDKYTTEIIVNGFQFLDSKPREEATPDSNQNARAYAQASGSSGRGAPAAAGEFGDDVPF